MTVFGYDGDFAKNYIAGCTFCACSALKCFFFIPVVAHEDCLHAGWVSTGVMKGA